MERELKDQLKKCAQFIPSAEFDQLVADIIKERSLKERIKELQDYRREGITTLEGKRKFDLQTPIKRRRSRRVRFTNYGKKNVNRWHRMRFWQKRLAETDT